MAAPLHVVTGAFGYSGKYIALRLLAWGDRVRTLTHSPQRQGRDPRLAEIDVRPFGFSGHGGAVPPLELVEAFRGADTFINTYWVRFNHREFSFREAVRNTRWMFAAAQAAGVRRIIHISITNPDAPGRPSRLEYFRGKGELEEYLRKLGVSHAILRPAVLFGKEDILVNNIAWLLRRMPFFGVFGDGRYKLQPIYVDDLAALAVDQVDRRENVTIEAIGPETFRYRELVEAIGEIIGKQRRIVRVPPGLGWGIGWLAGLWMRDVVITRDEIRGLMENRLFVDVPPPALAVTKLTAWARENREWLGSRYASELGRRRDRRAAYA